MPDNLNDLLITPNMRADEKIRRVNAIIDRELLPALERYYGRPLSLRERTVVYGHVSMLFMNPCPLSELSDHDNRFAERMLSRIGLNGRRN